MISIARDTTRNVKRWRDGTMIKRWCAPGMLNADRSFRRLKGHKQMPALVAGLERHQEPDTSPCDTEQVARQTRTVTELQQRSEHPRSKVATEDRGADSVHRRRQIHATAIGGRSRLARVSPGRDRVRAAVRGSLCVRTPDHEGVVLLSRRLGQHPTVRLSLSPAQAV